MSEQVYGHPSNIDFENLIRQSPLEYSSFEFKQGFLALDESRQFDEASFEKIVALICAISNCGPKVVGHIFVGICDKAQDAERIQVLDKVEPLEIDGRFIVGIGREAAVVKKTLEKYVHSVRDKIGKSQLSDPLKGSVVQSLSVINYYGREILHFGIPPQKDMSWVGEVSYYRDGDQTKRAEGRKIAELAARF